MKAMRLTYALPRLCRSFKVSKSGYYAWLTRKPSRRRQEEGRLEVEIRAAHKRTRETCGPERLQRDLTAHGITVGICRIRRMEEARASVQAGQEVQGDNRLESLPAAENLLNQQFQVIVWNEVWVSDITYVPTEEGWLYLAGHKDLCTGEVVGYALGDRLTRKLIN